MREEGKKYIIQKVGDSSEGLVRKNEYIMGIGVETRGFRAYSSFSLCFCMRRHLMLEHIQLHTLTISESRVKQI
jgi:hypothetical protein